MTVARAWYESVVHGLYAIVDIPHPHGLDAAEVCRAVVGSRIEGGVDGASTVQLRAKHATTAKRLELLETMAPACRASSISLLVNDDVEAALCGIEGVVGVHLGQGDPGFDRVSEVRERARAAGLSRFVVGVSTHDTEQARAAARQGVDYIGFGPVAATTSKARPDPVVGFDGLREVCRAISVISVPVVAIGGLDEDGGRRAIAAGAHAVAMIGALVDKDVDGIQRRAIRIARALRDAAQGREGRHART
jgi:thiamine-phosphate pyrophosphorylase